MFLSINNGFSFIKYLNKFLLEAVSLRHVFVFFLSAGAAGEGLNAGCAGACGL
jgi:hypothetical protein